MSTQRQPKGIPVGGQFAANAHDEAGGELPDTSFDVESTAASLEQEYDRAVDNERAAWMAYAFEHHNSFGDRVTIEFETEEDSDFPNAFSRDGDDEVHDSVIDVIPSGYRNGYIEIEKNEYGYNATIYDSDSGAETTSAFVLDSDMDELGEDDFEVIAEDSRTKRARIRDAREKVAIIDTFESTSYNGLDTATFTHGTITIEGTRETSALVRDGEFSIAPSDEWEANAFAQHGVNLHQMRVTREPDGYTIEREVTTPISKEKVWLTDRVNASSREAWSRSEL